MPSPFSQKKAKYEFKKKPNNKVGGRDYCSLTITAAKLLSHNSH